MTTTINVESLDDDALNALHSAFLVLHILDDDGVRPMLTALEAMPEDRRADIGDREHDETVRRMLVMDSAIIAHTIEQGDAAEADRKPRDRYKLMAHRTARLLRLLSMNAPEVIVDGAFDILVRT